MARLSLYEIKDMALESGRGVYTVQELSNLIGVPSNHAKVYMSRLVNKGLAVRVIRGRISFIQNDLVIGSQLIEPSYVSLNSALLFHNLTQQVPRNTQLVTTRNTITYEGLGLEYHKLPGRLFFGYQREAIAGSYTFVATPEKALVDGLYLHLYVEEDIGEYSEGLDFSKILEHLSSFSGKGSLKIKEVLKSLIKA